VAMPRVIPFKRINVNIEIIYYFLHFFNTQTQAVSLVKSTLSNISIGFQMDNSWTTVGVLMEFNWTF
jgi:hypothetical protein